MTIDGGTFARSTTGSPTYLLPNESGMTPKVIIYSISGKTSGDVENHRSLGWGFASTDMVTQNFGDTTGGKSTDSSSKVISHWSRVSGAITEKIAATLTSVDVGEFTMNFTAADVNYNIHFLAIGD